MNKDFLKEAASVKPNSRQLKWMETGFYAFIHFGVNTFTDSEWGSGEEAESIFWPRRMNCDQWVESIKSAGMKALILTAKHHDGFCLWPSKYTEHSVKNSSWSRDVVKEASDACKRGGIKFGFYLSPWDRNSKLYGTPEYNDYFCSQLTELLTNYGEISYVWFDNACGEGKNGKKQLYDFPRYINLIRKHQPDAVIFNDFGPDIRWCGNEAGIARQSEWAVVPHELCHYSEVQTGPGPMASEGDLSFLYNTTHNLGTLNNIMYSKGLTFTPSEINMSIRPGWFWHEKEIPHDMDRLFDVYINSVGANACFNLNIPPDKDGLIDERDVQRLKELGNKIRDEFSKETPADIQKTDRSYPTQPEFQITFESTDQNIKYVILKEDIARGQHVESFQIEAELENGLHFPLYQGTTIGNCKICLLKDPFEDQNPLFESMLSSLEKLILRITSARDEVYLKEIKVYEGVD